MKKISTTTAKKFRKMQKLTFGFRTEVANQVAAPAETRNTQLAASIDARLFLIMGAETLIKVSIHSECNIANSVIAENYADNPPTSVIPLDRRYSITSFIARSYALTAASTPLPWCSIRSHTARIVARVLSSGIIILHQKLSDYDASRLVWEGSVQAFPGFGAVKTDPKSMWDRLSQIARPPRGSTGSSPRWVRPTTVIQGCKVVSGKARLAGTCLLLLPPTPSHFSCR